MKTSSLSIALEFVRATEAAAIASVAWVGKGEPKLADKAATDAMRTVLNEIAFNGEVISGEGKKDKAPQLYEGEKVGAGQGIAIDLAVDPLECTDSVANGRPNATSVIAAGLQGSFLRMPDTYMDKIAVGPLAKGKIDLDASVAHNINAVARASGKPVSEIGVVVMDRPRHEALIAEIRATGARVFLITDGDVAGAIACAMPDSPIDMLLGLGGGVEGVQTAIALKAMGGDFQGRLQPKNAEHEQMARDMGYTDFTKKYTMDDLAPGDDVFFVASGIIDGPILKGIAFDKQGALVHSLVLHNTSRTMRFIETREL